MPFLAHRLYRIGCSLSTPPESITKSLIVYKLFKKNKNSEHWKTTQAQ